jgi:hypothetical protein
MNNTTNTSPAADDHGYAIEIGAARAEAWTDLQLSDPAREELDSMQTFDTSALERVVDLELEIRDRISTLGPAEGLQSFVAAAGSFSEAADRFSVINLVELMCRCRRAAGGRKRLPALKWPGWKDPDHPHRKGRVLTGVELGTVRVAALMRSAKDVVLVAVGEAGATADEATALTLGHFDRHRLEVDLVGGRFITSRTGSIPAWARDEAAGLLDLIASAPIPGVDEHRVLYDGVQDDPREMQKSVSMASLGVFKAASIGSSGSQVSYESLRRTTARRMHSAGIHIEDIAAFLGEHSLDRTRDKIGLAPPGAPVRRIA